MRSGFAEHMTTHWVQHLDRAVSQPLIAGWQQLEQATKDMETGASCWRVLQLPTGAGKTEALKLLCSRLNDELFHPGVLVVTKFRKEADKIAAGINTLASGAMAAAVHKEAPALKGDIRLKPMIVTTHAAYRLALRELANFGESHRWDRLHSYMLGKRGWIIIDEAFEWTDSYSVNLGNLRAAAGEVNGLVPVDLEDSARRLSSLANQLTNLEQQGRSSKVLVRRSEKLPPCRNEELTPPFAGEE